jgi:hypothetical protein
VVCEQQCPGNFASAGTYQEDNTSQIQQQHGADTNEYSAAASICQCSALGDQESLGVSEHTALPALKAD